ncbi:MAG: response regulator, partial [Caldimonas sp.]
QVRFAETISSAGNDLLVLINDILDLSKIEAGKFEVDSEPVLVARLVGEMARVMRPVAQQKRLAFATSVAPGAPERIETDAGRLGQILKNLLSNALKFTEAGEVALRVEPGPDGAISFVVKDTGIGISSDQHEVIFEAFRQADGSTHRNYGGTGLGLSISRDLARLLGGDISVRSTPGAGSVFTLTLPAAYVAPEPAAGTGDLGTPSFVSAPQAGPASGSQAGPSEPDAGAEPGRREPSAPVESESQVADDRDHLVAGARSILIIEDDRRFAEILRDMAREMSFQCIVAHTAGDGLEAAMQFRPSAILLDMNLPDHSGLGVLDQLKRSPKTRHIPVHVASVEDYSQQALERGAIGYVLKPVQRDQLVDVLRRLEAKFTQGLKRVLVVEDDQRQRESITLLLANDGVDITGVATAAEALARLQATTYDCMVMDLNLPDLSGYELLEQMAEQDGVSFPPVIVYTGRSLTRDEEQRLRRFSKSIIIKDARSPERLLDEVTLFLHQVESTLPAESQRILKVARSRDLALEGRRILVVEDDVRNIFALSSVLEPKGARIEIARNGREALEALEQHRESAEDAIDLVLMDIMMPEMDGLTAMREIRKRPEWKRLPIIALTAKAMKDDHDKCLAAGANDYIAKPLDVEKLLSLIRVWMPK